MTMPKPVHPKTETVVKYRWSNKPHKMIHLVEVLWYDAVSTGEDWSEDHEAATSKPAKSLMMGYLWVDEPTHITVIPLVNDSHTAQGITIPRGMIEEIRVLG